jgi:hypothetical protein
MRWLLASLLFAAMLQPTGCGSGSKTVEGAEKGPCYPNLTCNAGLTCLSGLCVYAGPSVSADAGIGTGGQIAPSGLDGGEDGRTAAIDLGTAGNTGSTGGNGGSSSENSDGALAVSGYTYVTIVDLERQQRGSDFSCSADNGPGADIDAVALIRKDETIGHGLVGSALFAEVVQDYQCKNNECPDEDCKYAKISKSLNGSDLLASTAGPPDAQVNKSGDDKGYLSLNGGILQIRIGNKDGQAPGQDILPGDKIKVFEVDLTKKTDGRTCAPERFQVVLQKAGSPDLTLRPSEFDKANSSVCGSSPSGDTQVGCGTSIFNVP